jgi:hypothetical protein
VKGKAHEALDVSGSRATTGTELMVPSGQVLEREKTAEVMTIDYTNEPTNGRRQITDGQSTGPRTELGKERSSQNAVKHGIFSKALLLKGESRAEFESLHTDLWEALRPEGRLEELLVDKLASISWRYRRFLLAEAGEIRKQFQELDKQRVEQEDRIADSLYDEDHLILNIQDPDVLKRCLELLAELRRGIQTTGFQQERDTAILEKIYGAGTYSRSRLQHEYTVWFDTARASEEERVREGYATPEQCKQNVLDEIRDEIRRLKNRHKKIASLDSQQNEIELLRRNVPESAWLDRVLRYEASLERAFDRALAQLERLQRQRLGQPVAPRIDVHVSG